MLPFRFLRSETVFVFFFAFLSSSSSSDVAPAAVKQNVKPRRDPVHLAYACSRHHQPQRDHHAGQLLDRRAPEVDDARLGAAHEACRVDGVDDDLPEVARGRGLLEAREVDAVKVRLPPEGRLRGHLGVELRVGEGCDVDAAEGLESF